MTLPLVIVNPASADGATREVWPKFASDLRTHFGPFTVVFTEDVGHGRALAAEAAKQGIKLIIACGGGGTLSQGEDSPLGFNQETEIGALSSCDRRDFPRSFAVPSRHAAAPPSPAGRPSAAHDWR